MDEDGFVILRAVFSRPQVDRFLVSLQHTLEEQPEIDAIRSSGGSIYAARNVLALWPAAASAWQQPPLSDALATILGPGFGLVRTLFFDKPPERSWALPWHKDLTIAVRSNDLPGQIFCKPTRKAGVPHVEAPLAVLEQMVTARIHLDDVTEENGPLRVIAGSHRTGKELRLGDEHPESITVSCGDVLLMRPLLAHSSGHSQANTQRHRRVLHLEFAASAELPDGYAWHDFRPG
jgi:hypothetical protein